MIVVTLVESFMPGHKPDISFVSLRKIYMILLLQYYIYLFQHVNFDVMQGKSSNITLNVI